MQKTFWPIGALIAATLLPQHAVQASSTDQSRAAIAQLRTPPVAPDIVGTAAVNAGVTMYDARFRRVSAADRNDAGVRALAEQIAGLSPVEQLGAVKRLVEARVRYKSDLDNVGVSDFWAGAGETLARGSGDDEDIAIVEMQVLKAAGFPTKDLYISVGRHKAKGAHSVLVARTDAGFFLLDQAEATVLPARAPSRFVPMLTIGAGRSWIHGYRRGGPRIAAR